MSRLHSFDGERPDRACVCVPRRRWPRAKRLLTIMLLAAIVGMTISYALRTLNF